MRTRKALPWVGLLMLSAIAVAQTTVGVQPASHPDGEHARPNPAQSRARTLGRKWILSSDFCRYPNQANPNPDSFGNEEVWYFMGSSTLVHDPATYFLLPSFITKAFLVPGIQQWQDPLNCFGTRANCLSAVGINATDTFQQVFGIGWPANVVRLHPTNSQLAIVGWRSPVNGRFQVHGRFVDMDLDCGDGIDWSIDRGGVSLAAGSIANGGSQVFSLPNARVPRGDYLYFIVDPKNEFGCDSTALQLTITLLESDHH
jgi:hypothetical protein